MDDVKVIDTEVSESCELMSAIQECIVELESALEAQQSQGKSQEFPSVVQPVSAESAGTSQGHVLKVFTHAKLPKLELKKFHGNPMHWYPFWESFESAVHKNPHLSSVDVMVHYVINLVFVSPGCAPVICIHPHAKYTD